MYQIMKNGVPIGLTERPTYVEPLDNGSYGLCDEAQARGIAHEGQVYSLEGKPALEGAETVVLVSVDTGAMLNMQAAVIAALTDELTSTQLALCEAYEAMMGGAE